MGHRQATDLGKFIALLDKAGDLVRIVRPVSPKYEIAAILDRVDKAGGQAVLFERVRGYRVPVIGNLLARKRRVALALGVEPDSLLAEYARRAKRRVKPRVLARGPVMQTRIDRRPDILKEIPALTHRLKDASPYFTSAVTIAKDPETGVTGMGIYRIQVRGPDEVSLNFQNPPLLPFLHKAEAMGRELEIAIVIGMDPLAFIASIFPVPPGTDRYEVAGALRGRPVDLVRCPGVDVLVHAGAEFVLEARVKPGLRVREGPFGESWGVYQEGRNPVAKITAIMRKSNPTYHALLPFSGEETALLGLSMEASMLDALRSEHPGVLAVVSDPFNRANVIVQMRKTSDAEPRKVLERVLSRVGFAKTAVVVDEDIDPNDPYAVGFAVSTRFDPGKGAVVLRGLRSTSLDPLAVTRGGAQFASKLGIDATRPLAQPKAKFGMVRLDRAARKRAIAIVSALDPRRRRSRG